jgi:hypothetical protein
MLQKIWHFLWHNNSIWSWIANVIVAFVVIKYLFLPGLGLLLGTPLPIVAVVSESMEHDGNFDTWWESECCTSGISCFQQKGLYAKQDITQKQFLDFPLKNGFNKGDLIVLTSAKNAQLGDVIVFVTQNYPEPIIHRLVRKDTTYSTKGDNNCGISNLEKSILPEQVIGKATFRIPLLGWIKILATDLLTIIIA